MCLKKHWLSKQWSVSLSIYYWPEGWSLSQDIFSPVINRSNFPLCTRSLQLLTKDHNSYCISRRNVGQQVDITPDLCTSSRSKFPRHAVSPARRRRHEAPGGDGELAAAAGSASGSGGEDHPDADRRPLLCGIPPQPTREGFPPVPNRDAGRSDNRSYKLIVRSSALTSKDPQNARKCGRAQSAKCGCGKWYRRHGWDWDGKGRRRLWIEQFPPPTVLGRGARRASPEQPDVCDVRSPDVLVPGAVRGVSISRCDPAAWMDLWGAVQTGEAASSSRKMT